MLPCTQQPGLLQGLSPVLTGLFAISNLSSLSLHGHSTADPNQQLFVPLSFCSLPSCSLALLAHTSVLSHQVLLLTPSLDARCCNTVSVRGQGIGTHILMQ